jgi:hypothetical protein
MATDATTATPTTAPQEAPATTQKTPKKYSIVTAHSRVKKIFNDMNVNKAIARRVKEIKTELQPYVEAQNALKNGKEKQMMPLDNPSSEKIRSNCMSI